MKSQKLVREENVCRVLFVRLEVRYKRLDVTSRVKNRKERQSDLRKILQKTQRVTRDIPEAWTAKRGEKK